ncbi:MAG: PTS sugar transporter subunit IIA [Candidatus Cloacimonetes bacterium]|nr:PTS sugar transporter subunit IIA [Candidatus Cloacimonadota bacterium]MBS3767504.1 PTS sugar transporter subunit IIA [Candidatus Cloacimonadota bacterium]
MKNIEIYKYLSPNHIIDVEANTKREALEEMIDVICTSPKISDKEKFSKKIFAREKLMSTGIGHGIAIPHIRDDSVSDFVIALGRKKEGLKYEAIDMEPVRLIFMIGGNKSQKQEYTSLLSQLTLRLKKKKFKNKLLTAHSPEEIYKEIKSKQ